MWCSCVLFKVDALFSKSDQIHSFLRTCSHLLKKSLVENLIACALIVMTITAQTISVCVVIGNYWLFLKLPCKIWMVTHRKTWYLPSVLLPFYFRISPFSLNLWIKPVCLVLENVIIYWLLTVLRLRYPLIWFELLWFC